MMNDVDMAYDRRCSSCVSSNLLFCSFYTDLTSQSLSSALVALFTCIPSLEGCVILSKKDEGFQRREKM